MKTKWALGFLPLCCAAIALAQTPATPESERITIRFLDVQSGKPLKGISVQFFAAADAKTPNAKNAIPLGAIKTDQDGAAVLLIPSPAPRYIEVADTFVFRGCAEDKRFALDEAMQRGIVASFISSTPGLCDAIQAKASVEPGEIVVFEQKKPLAARVSQSIP